MKLVLYTNGHIGFLPEDQRVEEDIWDNKLIRNYFYAAGENSSGTSEVLSLEECEWHIKIMRDNQNKYGHLD